MKNTTLILLCVLLNTVFCDNATNLRKVDSTITSVPTSYIDDVITCTSVETPSTAQCSAVNNQLTTTGTFQNQCCYLEYILDMERLYLLAFGKDYKTILDDYETTLDLKVCSNLVKDEVTKDTSLYSLAVITTKKEVNYNCGNEDVTFKASEFKPTTTAGKMGKEAADCYINVEKDTCLSTSENFETEVQCCWFSLIIDGEEGDEDDFKVSSCIGVQKISLEYFSDVETQMQKIKSQAGIEGLNYAFTCADKKGKKVTGTYDYKVGGGSLDIQTNEQSYSNFIGLTTFSILLIALLI